MIFAHRSVGHAIEVAGGRRVEIRVAGAGVRGAEGAVGGAVASQAVHARAAEVGRGRAGLAADRADHALAQTVLIEAGQTGTGIADRSGHAVGLHRTGGAGRGRGDAGRAVGGAGRAGAAAVVELAAGAGDALDDGAHQHNHHGSSDKLSRAHKVIIIRSVLVSRIYTRIGSIKLETTEIDSKREQLREIGFHSAEATSWRAK